jgi:hypothetical protein
MDATLLQKLSGISIDFRWPELAVPALSMNDFLLGAIYLALPQVPLTLGNAIIGMKEENNRLFPDRAVTVKGVATSTGIMNLFGAAVGGVPVCHGAGGMAAHTSFGARTGGSSIIVGVLRRHRRYLSSICAITCTTARCNRLRPACTRARPRISASRVAGLRRCMD